RRRRDRRLAGRARRTARRAAAGAAHPAAAPGPPSPGAGPMKRLYDLPAPAKLNLFLHVVGRRDDGYHLLQSVFMLIDWCDTLHLERRDDGAIAREDHHPGALPAEDLSVRAARMLQRASGTRQGVQIVVDKRRPA